MGGGARGFSLHPVDGGQRPRSLWAGWAPEPAQRRGGGGPGGVGAALAPGAGSYDPVLDDGVQVNIMPLQAGALLRYKKMV